MLVRTAQPLGLHYIARPLGLHYNHYVGLAQPLGMYDNIAEVSDFVDLKREEKNASENVICCK